MSVKSTRFTVLELLDKMDNGAYSNLALDSMLKSTDYSDRDKASFHVYFTEFLNENLHWSI